MDKEMRERIVAKDLDRLCRMGLDTDGHWMFDLYRQNAMKGEFDQIQQFVRPGCASSDVGANDGHYSLKLASTCDKVLAVEPLSDYAWLADELPPNCVFAGCAAGAQPGEAEINVPVSEGARMGGLASLLDLEPWGYKNCETETVQVRTLDELADEHLPDEEVGFVKIDVEGAELDVLRVAQELLERCRPNLQVELWQGHVLQAMDFIRSLGYRGLFFFDGVLHDISMFEPAVHCAEENEWRPDSSEAFRPELYVNNFFFVPAR